MKRIKIDEIKEGMVLCEPAMDQRGRILLGKGEVMTEKLIARLLNYGVRDIVVAEDAQAKTDFYDQEDFAESADKVGEIRETMQHMFSDYENNELMKKLQQYAEKLLLQELKKQV